MSTAGNLVYIQAGGTPLNAAGEVLTRISDTVWQVDNAARRVLVEGVTVEWDDVGWTSIPYDEVNLLTGTFTFPAPGYGAVEDLRIETGSYVPMSTVAQAHSYSISKNNDLLDVTRFLDAAKRRIASTKDISGTLSDWNIASTFWRDTLTAGNPLVLRFYLDATEFLMLWAVLDSVAMSAAIDSPQNSIVSFASDNYYD